MWRTMRVVSSYAHHTLDDYRCPLLSAPAPQKSSTYKALLSSVLVSAQHKQGKAQNSSLNANQDNDCAIKHHSLFLPEGRMRVIIIIKLPNQATASTPGAHACLKHRVLGSCGLEINSSVHNFRQYLISQTLTP
jgi:hypothetical protein